MVTLMGCGTVSKNDAVWEAIRINLTDPPADVVAFNAMMASDSAQAFPEPSLALGNRIRQRCRRWGLNPCHHRRI